MAEEKNFDEKREEWAKEVESALEKLFNDKADLEADLKSIKAEVAETQRLLAYLRGEEPPSPREHKKEASSKPKPKGKSLDPEEVAAVIKANGGKATVDEIKEALGDVDGRAVGAALRKTRDGGNQLFDKDKQGTYVLV